MCSAAMHESESFQLHHTGIKTSIDEINAYLKRKFQLHHTGIKTFFSNRKNTVTPLFQLHHTGIKTWLSINFLYSPLLYFNCTIQELKLRRVHRIYIGISIFQLHHTGIKTFLWQFLKYVLRKFQLHHTGIKTTRLV